MPHQSSLNVDIKQVALAQPNTCALITQAGEEITYAELVIRIETLSQIFLKKFSITDYLFSGVILYLKDKAEAAICMLALWEINIPVLLIDNTAESRGVEYTLQCINSAYLITTEELSQKLPQPYQGKILFFSELVRTSIPPSEYVQVLTSNDPSSLAYFMRTSGSSGGAIKWAMINHVGYRGCLAAQPSVLKMQDPFRIALTAPWGFDASLHELGTGLSCGGTVVFVPDEIRYDTQGLAEFYNHSNIEVAVLTPHLAALLSEYELKSLKFLYIVGDKFSIELAHKFIRKGIRVINGYGLTETSICAAMKEVALNDTTLSLKPIASAKFRIIGKDGETCGPHEMGRILIRGTCLMQGYLYSPDLNQPCWVDIEGERYLRTDDIGQISADGELTIAGRFSSTKKIHGKRFSALAMEECFEKISGVLKAHVFFLQTEPLPILGCLVAYNIALGTEAQQTLVSLLVQRAKAEGFESGFLPGKNRFYFVPERVFADKTSLVEYKKHLRIKLENIVPPRNEIEQTLFRIFQELLCLSSVDEFGVKDNFYDLGGTSLLQVQLFSRIAKQWGISIRRPIGELTIEDIAAYIYQCLSSKPMIDDTGQKQEIFSIHGLTCTPALDFSRLAVYMRKENLSCAALSTLPFDAYERSLHDIARGYGEKIEQRLPDKDIVPVCGWSAGGVVALVAASQLAREYPGKQFFVFMLDSAYPNALFKLPAHLLIDRLKGLAKYILHYFNRFHSFNINIAEKLELLCKKMQQQAQSPQMLDTFLQELKVAVSEQQAMAANEDIARICAFYSALLKYEINLSDLPANVKVHLFLAKTSYDAYGDEKLGWPERLFEKIHHCRSSNHFNIVSEEDCLRRIISVARQTGAVADARSSLSLVQAAPSPINLKDNDAPLWRNLPRKQLVLPQPVSRSSIFYRRRQMEFNARTAFYDSADLAASDIKAQPGLCILRPISVR